MCWVDSDRPLIGAAHMNTRHYLPLAISAVLIAGFAATLYLVDHSPFVEDADEVKAAVAADFLARPDQFDFEAASARLASSRMEGGFGVCAAEVEITAEQYIEIAEFTEKQAATPGMKLALNRALQDGSVSDCDYRVLLTLTTALKKEGKASATATNS